MMKVIKGTDRTLPRRPDDWDDEDCLCQGPVPEDKRVLFQEFLFSKKHKKRRWRNVLRVHADCPIHGVTIKTEDLSCREG